MIECKKNLVERFNLDSETIEISMGMSHDFEQAVRNLLDAKTIAKYIFYLINNFKIKMGSTNVRVGSLIFGERK